MSLLCKLIDHKYNNVTTREEKEERNNQTISVRIRTHECTRCNHVKEDRIRTVVEPEDIEESEEKTEKESENSKEYNKNNSIVQQNKALNDNMVSSEEDDSIILTNDKNNPQNNTKESVKISCKSCDYKKIEKEKHRRNGDFCPECGGWLKVD